jgi:hypothetical protein
MLALCLCELEKSRFGHSRFLLSADSSTIRKVQDRFIWRNDLGEMEEIGTYVWWPDVSIDPKMRRSQEPIGCYVDYTRDRMRC